MVIRWLTKLWETWSEGVNFSFHERSFVLEPMNTQIINTHVIQCIKKTTRKETERKREREREREKGKREKERKRERCPVHFWRNKEQREKKKKDKWE